MKLQTKIERQKENYGFSYAEHFDAMIRRKALFIKSGDAYNTEQRWKNSDIAGANEASKKIEFYTRTDLIGINRDYDYRSTLSNVFPQTHKELNGMGSEWHATPIRLIPKECITHFINHKEDNFLYAVTPIIEWCNAYIDKHVFAKFNSNNIKREIELRKLQKKVIKKIKKILRKHGLNCTIIAELAARIGKTILFLSLFKELPHQLMIIPAYVLSALSSYKKEADRWRDYKDMVFVDTIVDKDWEENVKAGLKAGKKVIVGVSLFGNFEDFKTKHKWLHNYKSDTVFLPEEADFGSHCPNQIEKQDWLCENKNITKIVTSGTNLARMSKGAGDNVVEVISLPYSLLEQSGDPGIVQRQMFQIYVNEAIQKLVKDFDESDRPTWKKLLEKPNANSDFIIEFFRSIYGYLTHYGMTLNGAADLDIIVSMVFMNTTKKAVEKLKILLDKALPDHHIVIINGDETTGRRAEEYAKQELRNVKYGYVDKSKVIFLANNMGSRSFSVGDIQACVFLTDGGGLDAYVQKQSRVLTPIDDELILVDEKEIGYSFSFSFDPNRTELDELQILYEARQVVNWFEEEGIEIPGASLPGIGGGLQYVLNSMNLKQIGFIESMIPVNVTAEMLMKDLEDDEKLLRVVGVCIDNNIVDIFKNERLSELCSKLKKMSCFKNKKIKRIIAKGITFGGGTSGNFPPNEQKELLKAIKLALNSIVYSSTTVYNFANFQGDSFEQCLDIIANDKTVDKNFEECYNISANEVKEFLPYLPVELLDISVQNQRIAQ